MNDIAITEQAAKTRLTELEAEIILAEQARQIAEQDRQQEAEAFQTLDPHDHMNTLLSECGTMNVFREVSYLLYQCDWWQYLQPSTQRILTDAHYYPQR